MFRIVCKLRNGLLKNVLRRWRLYHPPLHRLAAISQGSAESLAARAQEFNELIRDTKIDGTFKKTSVGRLAYLDQWVLGAMPESHPEVFQMLDVGGSDGSTTLDSVLCFKSSLGVPVHATILDKNIRLHCFHKWVFRYYLTCDHVPQLFHAGPLGFVFEETRSKEGLIFNPLARLARKWFSRHRIETSMRKCEDVVFKNPLLRDHPDIDWLEQDLFDANPALVEIFDLIRCSNLLNVNYFSEPRLREAVHVLEKYLKQGGLLLVSRSINDSTDSASVWKRTDQGLEHLADLNGGSEVKELLDHGNGCEVIGLAKTRE